MKLFCHAILILAASFPAFVSVSAQLTPPSTPLRQLAPGIFQLNSVRIDRSNNIVEFPASVNMTNGLIEYFVVTGTGKLHESLLKTETEPAQIHVAMLLLGVSEAKSAAHSTNLLGDDIIVEIRWKSGDQTNRLRAEEMIFNSESKKPMRKSHWIYNGSKVVDGTFIAQRDGSIVSIIADPFSLVNSSHPDRDNDEIWSVNTKTIPPSNTDVTVVFQLNAPKKPESITKPTK